MGRESGGGEGALHPKRTSEKDLEESFINRGVFEG